MRTAIVVASLLLLIAFESAVATKSVNSWLVVLSSNRTEDLFEEVLQLAVGNGTLKNQWRTESGKLLCTIERPSEEMQKFIEEVQRRKKDDPEHVMAMVEEVEANEVISLSDVTQTRWMDAAWGLDRIDQTVRRSAMSLE